MNRSVSKDRTAPESGACRSVEELIVDPSHSGCASADLRVAIVHDWLVTYAGAERVLEQILALFPTADLYTICDFVPKDQRAFLNGRQPRTSFVQRLPLARRHYRSYLPLMPLAVEQFDLSGYDLIISSSHSVAKGVITGPDQKHLCMCYSPMRYAWDLTHEYLREARLSRGLRSPLARYLLHRLRNWDYRTAAGVDEFIAISDFVRRRIRKVYGRDAEVVYPPVDVDQFEVSSQRDDYYVTVSRLVPYKRVHLMIEAFAGMPDRRLVVIGDGPEMSRLRRTAPSNVQLLGRQPAAVVREQVAHARAFVFAATEDFGIAMVEAQACGTPVIAFGRGGALEIVASEQSGMFFHEQSTASLSSVLKRFEREGVAWGPEAIRRHSTRFSIGRFRHEFTTLVQSLANGRMQGTRAPHFVRPSSESR